tara:strand:+ start:1207 stop:1473 length:267 start_codon:yes stop_codon:yes gene_type:complete
MENLVLIEIECEGCNGEGSIEIGPECDQVASMCCGGCYREELCKECNGEANIASEWNGDDLQSLINAIFESGASIESVRELVIELIKK